MIKLVLIIPFFLSGCFYQTINQQGIEQANIFCKDKGGVFEISEYYNYSTYVVCRNGIESKIDK